MRKLFFFCISLCLIAISITTANADALKITVDDPFIKPGEQVFASIDQSDLTQPISGIQAFLRFDNELISIDSSRVTAVGSPFGLMIHNQVQGTDIDIAVGANVFANQGPCSVDAKLVDLAFTAGSVEGTAFIRFREHNPASRLTDPDGNEIIPELIDSPPIVIDGTPPVITACARDITVPNDPGFLGAFVDPGTPVAVDDLSGIGSIVGVRADGKPLDAIYPIGLTTIRWTVSDRSGNVARCVQRVVVYAIGVLEPVVTDPYVRPGEAVYVSLKQSDLLQPVTGFQAFMSFDTAMMSISKPDISFTGNPYGLVIYKVVNGGDIDLAAGINVFSGQQPTWDDAVLAVMKFTAGSTEGITHINFRATNPPSRFTDLAGESIYPVLTNSRQIIIDSTPPFLTAPADVLVTAATGADSAVVNLPVPDASDQLSGMASVVGARSDEQPLGSPYPVGATAVIWTATDRAGNTSECMQLVVVAPYGFDGVIARSVGEAKQMADGSGVALVSPVCTRLFGSYFYVEDANRAAGIRVNRVIGMPLAPGMMPALFGEVHTISGERVVCDTYVAPYSAGIVPDVIGMNGVAANHILPQGLLVKLWGRVELIPGMVTLFTLHDGSPSGVRVRAFNSPLPADGSYVAVTGVVGFESGRPVLRVNHNSDIVTIQQ